MADADQRVRLWSLIAEHAAALARPVSVADVCAVAASQAQVNGSWVTAASTRGPDFVMGGTTPVSEQLAEVQLMLGEGPCCDVLASAKPVLAGDLGDGATSRRWVAFVPAARKLGAAAVFGFPLTMGAIQAGVLGLYRSSAGPLAAEQLRDCLLLSDIALVLLLSNADQDGHGAAGGSGADGQPPDLALHRTEIDQATGMLTVQLEVNVAEAFARLRAYAYAQDRRLSDVAADIVGRRLRLPSHRDGD